MATGGDGGTNQLRLSSIEVPEGCDDVNAYRMGYLARKMGESVGSMPQWTDATSWMEGYMAANAAEQPILSRQSVRHACLSQVRLCVRFQ